MLWWLAICVSLLQSDAARPLTQMVDAMIGSKKTIDEKLADAQFKMFTDSALDSVWELLPLLQFDFFSHL